MSSLKTRLFTLALYITVVEWHVKSRRFSARLIRLFIRYSGRRPSYIILSSPYTCAQLRIVLVHLFVQFKVLDFDKAVKSAEDEDKYEVDLSVPSITDEMENIQLLCYNKEKNEWSIAEPISVDKKNKTIKVALEDLCYFAIIADAKEENTTK